MTRCDDCNKKFHNEEPDDTVCGKCIKARQKKFNEGMEVNSDFVWTKPAVESALNTIEVVLPLIRQALQENNALGFYQGLEAIKNMSADLDSITEFPKEA